MKHTTLPDVLRAHRKRHRLSAEGLAARLGVTRQTVSRWECNTSRPTLDHYFKLSEELGIEMGRLVKLATKETT